MVTHKNSHYSYLQENWNTTLTYVRSTLIPLEDRGWKEQRALSNTAHLLSQLGFHVLQGVAFIQDKVNQCQQNHDNE